MYKLLLIWRYFLKKRVAYIAVLAVLLLVMLVLVVLSIMSGLLEDTRRRNHRWTGDLVVGRDSLVGFAYYDEWIAALQNHPQVEAAAPVIKTFGLIQGGGARQLMGIDMESWCRVTHFQQTLFYQKNGRLPSFAVPAADSLPPDSQPDLRGCILGYYMLAGQQGFLRPGPAAAKLSVTVFGLNSRGQLAGSGIGEQQFFWYVDDSESGLVDIDSSVLYVDFHRLQKLCYMDGLDGQPRRASEVRIKLKENVSLAAGKTAIAGLWRQFATQYQGKPSSHLLADVRIETWKEYRRSRIAPAEKEKSLMIVIFAMIGFVAVFIIFAIFYMIVTEKIKDLGIVKSVGGSRLGISQIFLGYGALVGLVGAVIGTILGILIVTHSNEIEGLLNAWFGFRLWDPDVYAISRIPDAVDYGQAAVIGLVAILACILGASLPARRAAKLEVVETLRVD